MGDCVCPHEVCSIHGDNTGGGPPPLAEDAQQDAGPQPLAEALAEHRSNLAVLMEAQASLQRESFQDIYALGEEERMEFVRWNVLALEDELHEMLGECGWKPWATSRHVNPTAALRELVDGLHFYMNLVMAVACRDESGMTVEPWELGEALGALYFEKRAVNAARQAEGYTGLEKCPGCRRDSSFFERDEAAGITFCRGCGKVLSAPPAG